jgi:glutamine amidotransferase PdxT
MLSLKGIQSQSLEEVKQKLLSMPKKEYDFTVNLNCFGKQRHTVDQKITLKNHTSSHYSFVYSPFLMDKP